jgi:hypothetical protein
MISMKHKPFQWVDCPGRVRMLFVINGVTNARQCEGRGRRGRTPKE